MSPTNSVPLQKVSPPDTICRQYMTNTVRLQNLSPRKVSPSPVVVAAAVVMSDIVVVSDTTQNYVVDVDYQMSECFDDI